MLILHPVPVAAPQVRFHDLPTDDPRHHVVSLAGSCPGGKGFHGGTEDEWEPCQIGVIIVTQSFISACVDLIM